MNPLVIGASKSTPLIEFDPETGILRMEGDCYPEDAASFFQPVLGWLQAFLSSRMAAIVVELRLNYLNTSSAKCMMTFLGMLESVPRTEGQITVNWRYEAGNDMALECARELTEDLRLRVNIIQEGG